MGAKEAIDIHKWICTAEFQSNFIRTESRLNFPAVCSFPLYMTTLKTLAENIIFLRKEETVKRHSYLRIS